MADAKSYKGVIKHINQAPQEVQDYFWLACELIEKYPWEVSLAWMFSRLELAQNMCLYCAAVKLHKTDATLTRDAIDAHYMSRKDFKELYKTIVGKTLTESILDPLKKAEGVRDRVMHGKIVPAGDFRKAIVAVIDFATGFNSLVQKHAGFKPFSDLRGFKGAGKPLDRATTNWILRGMGLR